MGIKDHSSPVGKAVTALAALPKLLQSVTVEPPQQEPGASVVAVIECVPSSLSAIEFLPGGEGALVTISVHYF